MKTWSFDSPDPDSTHETARRLGRSIGGAGLVIGLVGPLGAGKTAFVKGLAEGLGVPPDVVSSPTFVIAQQYPIRDRSKTAADSEGAPEDRPEVLNHVDLYRLEDPADELDAIGFDELFVPGRRCSPSSGRIAFPGVLGVGLRAGSSSCSDRPRVASATATKGQTERTGVAGRSEPGAVVEADGRARLARFGSNGWRIARG